MASYSLLICFCYDGDNFALCDFKPDAGRFLGRLLNGHSVHVRERAYNKLRNPTYCYSAHKVAPFK